MHRSIVAIIIALLLVPAALAQAVPTADGFRMEGDVRGEGIAAGVTVVQLAPDGVASVDDGRLSQVTIQAVRAHVLRWTETGVAGPSGFGLPQIAQGASGGFERLPANGYITNFRLQGGDHDVEHIFNVIAASGAALRFNGDVAEPERLFSDVSESFCLGEFGLDESLTCEGYNEQAPYPAQTIMPSPSQRVVLDSAGKLHVGGGNLVIDVLGIDLSGSLDLPGRVDVASTGGPYTAYFTRLVLEDASISFRVDGGHDQVAWAVTDMALALDGTIDVEGGRGQQRVGDHTVDLATQDHLEGQFLLTTTPTPAGMTFDLSEAGADVDPDAANSGIALTGLSWLPATLLSILPLLGTALVVRRAHAHTTMRHVEDALGQQRFRRAARLAGRVLRFNPVDESAHLGKAIALTKSGRASRAAAGLESLLEEHEPADGTLHYALGVALSDLGRADDARAAMAAAVKRTPALLGGAAGLGRDDGGAYT